MKKLYKKNKLYLLHFFKVFIINLIIYHLQQFNFINLFLFLKW